MKRYTACLSGGRASSGRALASCPAAELRAEGHAQALLRPFTHHPCKHITDST